MLSDPETQSLISRAIGPPTRGEALAARSSVGKVNDEFASTPLRNSLGDQFGSLSGWVVSEFSATVVAHDPVIEAFVRDNVNSISGHWALLQAALIVQQEGSMATMMAVNFLDFLGCTQSRTLSQAAD